MHPPVQYAMGIIGDQAQMPAEAKRCLPQSPRRECAARTLNLVGSGSNTQASEGERRGPLGLPATVKPRPM